MKRFNHLFVVVILFCITFSAIADDGMWMPHQMKDLNLKALGLEMNPDDLYKKDGTGLMSAVVSLGGGTGEFVSKNGLILTNHHVAFGGLQRASDTEHDYMNDGFIAWNREEELPAPGYIADVLIGYEEITKKILSVIKPGMTYREKYEAIDQARKKLIANAEKEGEDIRARVANMYSGNKYYLFLYKRIKDIRIVYAPPKDLGNFGGDIDNWMWPRHTCDFSFLRAYVSKDNIGTDYSTDNVPYKPKSILTLAIDGVGEGDFTFVMGYPGRTFRNHTLSQLKYDVKRMKQNIELFKDVINFGEEASKKSKEVEIKYAGKVRGLNNALKNFQGKIEGMEKVDLLKKKKGQENEFLKWVQEGKGRHKAYGNVLKDMSAFMKRYIEFNQKNQILGNVVNSYLGSVLLSQAHLIYRTVQEREKPDNERDASYQDRNFDRLKMRINLAERGYDLETDRAFSKQRLKKLFDYPIDEIPDALKELIAKQSEEAVDDFVDDLYDRTALADPEVRLKLIEMTPEELKKKKDPMIQLAARFEEELSILREKGKALSQENLEKKRPYLKALLDKKKGRMAPDANGTIRFTYGPVEGYVPRDAVYYTPLTTLRGVIEKDTGEFPFNVPEKLKALYKERDFGPYAYKALNDVPTCFLNTTNVTGGSSGSPTLNARGEQVGIIFDMTYESVIGDYYVIPELQRSISVDIRYVLFITDKFSGAKHILEELSIK